MQSVAQQLIVVRNSWKHPLLYGAIGTLLIVLLLMLKKANF